MEGPEEKLEHQRSYYQFSLRIQAHPAAEVEPQGRSVLGSLREALSLCNHALMLYIQEPSSELGATVGQQSQQLGCGVEVTKDKLEPTVHVCICPSLILPAVITASLPPSKIKCRFFF